MGIVPEKDVKRDIRSLFNKYDVSFFMPIGGPYARPGVSDFIGCCQGTMLAVEAKATGKKPSAVQKDYLEEVIKAGGIALVVDDTNLFVLERILIALCK